jgi:hypothetical protein
MEKIARAKKFGFPNRFLIRHKRINHYIKDTIISKKMSR